MFEQSIHGILEKRSKQFPHKVAFRFFNEKENTYDHLIYKEFYSKANQIANHFLQNQKEYSDKQKKVLLLFPSGFNFISAFFGCLLANHIAIPTSLPQSARSISRLNRIIQDCKPDIIFSEKKIYNSFSKKLEPVESTLEWITVEEIQEAKNHIPISNDLSKIAFIQYSSGSTSEPKGVVISHHNIIANQEMIRLCFGHNENDSIVGWLPLFHDMGLIGNVLHPIYMGLTCTLMSPVAFLQKPIRWLEAISRFNATTSGGPNFAYDLCSSRIDEASKKNLDLSSWRIAFNGSEKVHSETLVQFEKAFSQCQFQKNKFFSCYGLAEATLLVSGTTPEISPCIQQIDKNIFETKGIAEFSTQPASSIQFVSAGQPPQNSVFIVHPETCQQLPRNFQGEIWLTGPHIARGYLNHHDLNEKVFEAKLKGFSSKFLRTGDLGFINENGELFVTGRLKELIILKGRNIHPQDIERSISNHFEEVQENGIAAFSHENGIEEKLVVICEIKRTSINKVNIHSLLKKLKQHISAEFQVQLHDALFIKTNRLPKTSSGKIQRVKAKQLYETKTIECIPSSDSDSFSENKTNLQIKISEILNINIDDAKAPLSTFGIDSLQAIELQIYISENYGVDIAFEKILFRLSVLDLENLTKNKNFSPKSSTDCSTYPLTEQQKRLWYFHQLEQNQNIYNVALPLSIVGDFDIDKARQAVKQLLKKHPTLSASFECNLDGEILQKINLQESIPLFTHDAKTIEDVKGKLNKIILKPYDLEESPLFRIDVFKIGTKETVLVFSAHHIIADLWSVGILLRDFLNLYNGRSSRLQNPNYSFYSKVKSELKYLNSSESKNDFEFWKQHLPPNLPLSPFKYDFPREGSLSFKGDFSTFEIKNEFYQAVKEFAHKNQLSSLHVFLSAYYLFLAKISNEQTQLIGTTFAGRPNAGCFETIGFFSNPVPLAIKINNNLSFLELTKKIKNIIEEVYPHAKLPFSMLLEQLISEKIIRYNPKSHPLFSTMCVMQTVPSFSKDKSFLTFPRTSSNSINYDDFSISSFEWRPRISLYDLSLFITETEESYLCLWEFNCSLFKKQSIERFSTNFLNILQVYIENPELLIHNEIKENTRSIQKEAKTLSSTFSDTAKESSHHIAVYDNINQYTFSFIDKKSDLLAGYFHAQGLFPHDIVGLHFDYSIELVCILLALFKIGITFVPIDPNLNLKRKNDILTLSKAVCLISDEFIKLEQHIQIIHISSFKDINLTPSFYPKNTSPSAIAYILFTSGSTGEPKGVMVSHDAILNYLESIHNHYFLEQGVKFAGFTSLSFDLSLTALLYPIIFGGSLELFKRRDDLDNTLENLLKSDSITHLKMTPSHLETISQFESLPRNLKMIIVGGEQLSYQVIQPLFELNPDLTIINEYGPTETTIGCVYYKLTKQDLKVGSIPIGKPFSNTQVCIESSGELSILGPLVSYGYYNGPKHTATVFTPSYNGLRKYHTGDLVKPSILDPKELMYIGRNDRQVKISGYRVDLSEIENAILELPFIVQCVVTFISNALCCYYISKRSVLESEMHNRLSDLLPSYMLPKYLIECESFPLTTNGKLDLKKLPKPNTYRALKAKTENSETENHQILLNIWRTIFKNTDISFDDNFFDLAGDSIKAIQIITLAKKQQISFTIGQLFENPTINKLCNILKKESIEPQRVLFEQSEIRLSPLQNESLALNSNIDNFVMGALLSCRLSINLTKLKGFFYLIAKKHPALRSSFSQKENELLSKLIPIDQIELDISKIEFDSENSIEDYLQFKLAQNDLGLNLTRGPLFKVELLKTSKTSKILILVHHFIIDGVSWRVLLSELDSFFSTENYQKDYLSQNESISYAFWLHEMNQNGFNESRLFWTEYFLEKNLPIKAPRNETIYRDKKVFYYEVPKLILESASTVSRQLFKVSLQDLFVYLFSFAWLNLFDQEYLVLHVESHGRGALENLDLTETIGWFTSKYPLVVKKSHKVTPFFHLHNIQAELRELSKHKDSYLFLDRSQHPRSEFCFNFLGEVDSYNTFNVNFLTDLEEGKNSTSPYKIEVNCWIEHGQLVVNIRHDQEVVIENFKKNFFEELEKINSYSKFLENHLLSSCYHFFPSKIEPQDILKLVSNSSINSPLKVFPLFPSQHDLLVESIKNLENQVFYEKVFFNFIGEINTSFFEQSIHLLADKYEALRTQIIYKNSIQPIQLVNNKSYIPFYFENCTGLNDYEISSAINKQTDTILSIDSGPLFKVFLFKINTNTYYCYWVFHHIILDGWSLSNLFRDWLVIYDNVRNQRRSKSLINFELQTYFTWLKNQTLSQAIKFWKNYLNRPFHTPLLSNNINTQAPYIEKELSTSINANYHELLKRFCSTKNLTLNTLFQFFWGLTLSVFSNSDKLLFASVVSGRPAELPDVDQAVGLFTNALPTFFKSHSNKALLDSLIQFQKEEINKEPYAYLPFSEILKLIPNVDISTLSLFVFENYPFSGEAKSLVHNANLPFKLENASISEKTGYDLTLSIIPSNDLEITIQFNSQKFDQNYIEQIFNFYIEVIKNAPQILSDNNFKDWLENSNLYYQSQKARGYFPLLSQNLLEYFKDCVNTHLFKLALVDEERQITYQALDRISNHWARQLIDSGVEVGNVVGVAYGRSIEQVIAYLAILKCGATYLPLDLNWPKSRIEEVISQSEIKTLLSSNHLTFQKESLSLSIESSPDDKAINLPDFSHIHPKLPAYILFTSGSTGVPKGIQVPHEALLNHFIWTKTNFNLSSKSKMLQMTEITFDVSLSEFHSIFSGGTLYFLPENAKKDSSLFFEFINKHKITHVQLVPSFLKVLNETKTKIRLDSVRHILCGAESLSEKDLHLFFKQYNIPISNIYGLTETCIDSVFETYKESSFNDPIFIGMPIENTHCFLLNDKLLPTPAYVPGELHIGGSGLALGYLNNQKLTAELFVPDPTSTGNRLFKTGDLCYWNNLHKLVFIGRLDQQLKIRGMRVELSEIESILESYPPINQASIIPKKTENFDEIQLLAFYTSSPSCQLEHLKSFMRSKLPHYMQPTHYLCLSEMPMTSSGKVDRKKLSILPITNCDQTYFPTSKTEQKLQSIWGSILGIKPSNIDPNASFFDLGGNSIGIMKMQNEVNHSFAQNYGVDIFFREPSIKNLASLIDQKQCLDGSTSEISNRLKKQAERHKERNKWVRPTV